MATGVASWSQTAGDNASADSTVNYAEGQAPSSINDSARAAMASVAKWRDDIAGAIATGGSSTAFTVTSYQGFASLSALSGKLIAFTPHTTNTGSASTLNVDSLGAKAIRSAPNVEIPAGTLIQGTPYVVLYNTSDSAFYLQGFFGNPYNIPIGATIDFWAGTAPNSSFVFPFGQAISRTTYSVLFALIGANYGSGDGSTTFNLPDLRGRVVASPDNMGGGVDQNRLTGSASIAGSRNSIGGSGGTSSVTLVAGQIPSITSSGSISVTSTSSTVITGNGTTTLTSGGAGALFQGIANGTQASGAITSTGTANVTSNNTGSTAVDKMPPTILCNRIMRII